MAIRMVGPRSLRKAAGLGCRPAPRGRAEGAAAAVGCGRAARGCWVEPRQQRVPAARVLSLVGDSPAPALRDTLLLDTCPTASHA